MCPSETIPDLQTLWIAVALLIAIGWTIYIVKEWR